MNSDEQFLVYRLLKNHEHMFDGVLGNYNRTKYQNEPLEGAQPYHAKPFPIPKPHGETLKADVNRLVRIGVLNH